MAMKNPAPEYWIAEIQNDDCSLSMVDGPHDSYRELKKAIKLYKEFNFPGKYTGVKVELIGEVFGVPVSAKVTKKARERGLPSNN